MEIIVSTNYVFLTDTISFFASWQIKRTLEYLMRNCKGNQKNKTNMFLVVYNFIFAYPEKKHLYDIITECEFTIQQDIFADFGIILEAPICKMQTFIDYVFQINDKYDYINEEGMQIAW